MRKKLDIDIPQIRTYLRQGYPVSMVRNNDWIYDKYVQLFYDKTNNENKYVNYLNYNFFEKDGVFFKGYHLFPYKKRRFLIQEIIDLVDEGWFYFGKWNEVYIPNTYYHLNQIPYEHRNLVYGYDTEKNVFLVQGYLADWKWHEYEVKFYDFCKSLIDQSGFIEFETYKLNKSYEFCFSIDNLREELNQYIHKQSKEDANLIYGISAVRLFWQEILDYYKENLPIDQTSVYIFCERANTMQKRLEILRLMGSLSEDDFNQFVKECKMIENEYAAVVNKMIKYNIMPNKKLTYQVAKEGMEVSEREYKFFKKLMEKL